MKSCGCWTFASIATRLGASSLGRAGIARTGADAAAGIGPKYFSTSSLVCARSKSPAMVSVASPGA